MPYKIKDLMIHVLPGGQFQAPGCNLSFGVTGSNCCNTCSGCTCSGCTHGCSGCSGHSCGCSGTDSSHLGLMHHAGSVFAAPQTLAELKNQLTSQLALIEQQEKALEESMRPKTLQDVEVLEKRLLEALEELKVIKAQLGSTK